MFITALPITKLFVGERESGGHVLRETTSPGLCELVCPSHTSERGGEGYLAQMSCTTFCLICLCLLMLLGLCDACERSLRRISSSPLSHAHTRLLPLSPWERKHLVPSLNRPSSTASTSCFEYTLLLLPYSSSYLVAAFVLIRSPPCAAGFYKTQTMTTVLLA